MDGAGGGGSTTARSRRGAADPEIAAGVAAAVRMCSDCQCQWTTRITGMLRLHPPALGLGHVRARWMHGWMGEGGAERGGALALGEDTKRAGLEERARERRRRRLL